MNHAEEFETILHQCLDDLAGGADVDACLDRFPEHAAALAPLLEIAHRLRQCPPPVLSDATRRAVRDRAHGALARRMPTAPSRRHVWAWSRPGRLAAACCVALVLVVGGLWSGVAAAQGSLPGDVLYGVKLGTERIRLDFASGGEQTTALYLEFAARRLDETLALVAVGRTPSASALADLTRDYAAARQAIAALPPAARAPLQERYEAEIQANRGTLASVLSHPLTPSTRTLLEPALRAGEDAAERLPSSQPARASAVPPAATPAPTPSRSPVTSARTSATPLTTSTASPDGAAYAPINQGPGRQQPGSTDDNSRQRRSGAPPSVPSETGGSGTAEPSPNSRAIRPSAGPTLPPPAATIRPTPTSQPGVRASSPNPAQRRSRGLLPDAVRTPTPDKPSGKSVPAAPRWEPGSTGVPRSPSTPRLQRRSLPLQRRSLPLPDPTPTASFGTTAVPGGHSVLPEVTRIGLSAQLGRALTATPGWTSAAIPESTAPTGRPEIKPSPIGAPRGRAPSAPGPRGRH